MVFILRQGTKEKGERKNSIYLQKPLSGKTIPITLSKQKKLRKKINSEKKVFLHNYNFNLAIRAAFFFSRTAFCISSCDSKFGT